MNKLDESKPIKEMNSKEKMLYYFFNCPDRQNDSKIKEIIEADKVVQMVDKRVNQIEDDYWRKLDQDFAELEGNYMKTLKERYEQAKALNEQREQKLAHELNKKRKEALEKGF